MQCPFCGQPAETDSVRCKRCGTKLEAESEQPQHPPDVVPPVDNARQSPKINATVVAIVLSIVAVVMVALVVVFAIRAHGDSGNDGGSNPSMGNSAQPYEPSRSESTSTELTPRISDEDIMEQVPSLIKLIDKKPYKDGSGNTIKLSSIYKGGFDVSVIENATDATGGMARLSIEASNGVANYRGEITVQFSGESGDWAVKDCSVNDEAYQADYSMLVGTWTGDFIGTEHNSVTGQAACYGGKNNPPTVVIKSVDSKNRTAVADVTFLVHKHPFIKNAIESDPEDTVVTVHDILVSIPKPESELTIYKGDDPAKYELRLRVDGDKLVLSVYTGYTFRGANTIADWRMDTFSLEKRSDS